MNLLIMDYPNALSYVPVNNTYAIRIGGSYRTRHNISFDALKESLLYKVTKEYIFDDINPASAYPESVLFGPKIAEKIIKDFEENRRGCEDLLVHCSYGKNRSPAVAMAINEIFNLGNDIEKLKSKYYEFNHYVYITLIEEGKFLGIK